MKNSRLKTSLEPFLLYKREAISLLLLIPFLLFIFYSHLIYNFIYSSLYEETPPYEIIDHATLQYNNEMDNLFKGKINPNHLTVEEWRKLHFSENVSFRIVKYRLKGGMFTSEEDLLKIYDIDTLLLKSISKHFIYPERKQIQQKKYKQKLPSHKLYQKKKGLEYVSVRKFDPNTVEESHLLAMHFPKKVIQNLINYRQNGGYFYHSDDFKKLYSVDSLFFDRIKDSIHIALSKREVKAKVVLNVNLNKATKKELVQLRGIGSTKAQRIIDYRKKLGGSFYKKEQLREVFSIDSVLYESLKEEFYIETSDLQFIKINTVTYEQLATHPYLNYRQARWIIKYRENHGKYHNIEDILKIKTIALEDLKNIQPYLDFE